MGGGCGGRCCGGLGGHYRTLDSLSSKTGAWSCWGSNRTLCSGGEGGMWAVRAVGTRFFVFWRRGRHVGGGGGGCAGGEEGMWAVGVVGAVLWGV